MSTIYNKIYLNKFKKLKETGFFHIFGSNVINKIIVFFSSIILVRILSKSEYGIFSYSMNILSIFMLFNGLGMGSGVLQLCSEHNDNVIRTKEIYRYGSSISIIFNITLGIVILVFSNTIELPIEGANQVLSIMAFMPLFMGIYELQGLYLRINLMNKEYSIGLSINTILVFIFSCIGAILLKEKGLVFFRYIAYVITIYYLYDKFKVKFYLGNYTLNNVIKKDLYKISIISMANNGISHLLYLLDILIIGIVIQNDNIIASYKTATLIPSALTFIPLALITYIYPYFAKNYKDKQWVLKKYKEVTMLMIAFNIIICTLLIILAPWIIKIMFGNQYIDAILPFRILVVSYFFSSVFRIIPGNILVTQKKLKFNFYVALISGLINIVGNIIFINQFGSVGAAITTLMVVIVSSILNTVYLLKILKYKE